MKLFRKIEKKDIAITFLLLLIAFFLGWGIYLTYKRRLASVSGESIGFVRYKYHIVMRKYADRMVWEDVEPETPVFLYDAVLTKDQSDAEIVLKNGMHFRLEPNTLVIIEPLEKEIGVKLQEGSLYSTGSKEKAIVLLEDNTELEIKDAKVRITKQNDQVFLETEEGNVFLKGEKYNLKLNAGEAIELQKEGSSQKRKLILMKQYPSEGEVIRTSEKKTKVRFRWEAPLDKEQTLILGKNPQLDDPQKFSVGEKTEYEVALSRGKYFWQVQAKEKQSKIYSFRVAPKSSLNLVSPQDQAKFSSQEDVNFIWQKSDEGEPVVLEVSQDENFEKIFIEKPTSQSSLTLNLPPGRYFWRLRTSETVSEKRLLEILNPPPESMVREKLQEPPKLEKITLDKFIEQIGKTIVLSWKPQKKAESYRVRLSQDPKLKDKKTRSFQTQKPNIELNLDEGTYYWQVEALSDKKVIAQSSVQSFSVKKPPALKPPIVTEVRVD